MPIVNIPANELLEESNPKINANFSELDTRTGAVEDRFDGSGVLLPANLPSLARITPSVVASEAAMLALDAQSGDVAVRTDLDPDRSFMLGGDGNPATLASWIPITFATSGAGTGHTVADEGTPVAARGTLNFTGAGVTVTDDGANDQTDVDIPGAASSGGGPAWMNQTGAGSLFAAYGNGDPVSASDRLKFGNSSISASVLGTTNAYGVMFSLPKSLAELTVRIFGYGTTASFYRFAIYRTSDAQKIWESGAITITAGVWNSVSSSASLAANTNYLFCVASTSTSGASGIIGVSNPLSAGVFGANAPPLGGRSIGIPAAVQFACSAGAYPATLPALAANGSVPTALAFLEGSAS